MLGKKNDNSELIKNGANPVDLEGQVVNHTSVTTQLSKDKENTIAKNLIKELLKKGLFSAEQILVQLVIEWTIEDLRHYLNNEDEITVFKGSPKMYTHANSKFNSQTTLF